MRTVEETEPTRAAGAGAAHFPELPEPSEAEPAEPAAPTTRPAPAGLIKRCGFCGNEVIWLTLSNGQSRTFEPCEYRTVTVDARVVEQSGFALRHGKAVALSCVQHMPQWMVMMHTCSAYREALAERRYGVERLSDIVGPLVPPDDHVS